MQSWAYVHMKVQPMPAIAMLIVHISLMHSIHMPITLALVIMKLHITYGEVSEAHLGAYLKLARLYL